MAKMIILGVIYGFVTLFMIGIGISQLKTKRQLLFILEKECQARVKYQM